MCVEFDSKDDFLHFPLFAQDCRRRHLRTSPLGVPPLKDLRASCLGGLGWEEQLEEEEEKEKRKTRETHDF
ncbi:hypothetical protein SK128_027380 [Halocaridina rubra]|uniref:Uncharacterized protein n=1 Tax=Halocaridina rubra TaxID=373956 RepID=A0AAN8WUG2_HALRR